MPETVGRLRWVAKKMSRHAVVLASRGTGRRRPSGAPEVRALMYHRVRSVAREPFSVTPDDFEAQMAWLARERHALSLADVEHAIAGTGRLRPTGVLVTIDDGYRDVYSHALPILARHAIPAVLFVSVGAVEDRPSRPSMCGARGAHVSWAELAELVRAGITIGSHGWEHRSLAAMSLDEAERQAAVSRDVLEQRLGVAVHAFAYPFGRRADYNAATHSALVRSGYRIAFTAQHGAIGTGADPLALPRIKIEGGEGLWMFRQLVAGGLDGWSLIDRYLWRVQAGDAARA